MDTSWKRLLYLICAIQIGAGITIVGILSFIPLYLVELGLHDPGEAAVWAGLVSGVTPFMVALSAPYWSLQANKRGPRPVMMAILATLATAVALSGFAQTPMQLLVLRTLQGLVGGFVPIGLAIIVFAIPEEKHPWAMGLYQASLVMGLVFGPLLGGLAADVFGYRTPFFMFSALSAICCLGVYKWMPTLSFPHKEQESQWSLLRYFLGISKVRMLAILMFLCNFGITGIGPILPLYIKHYMPVDESYLATIVGIIIFGAGICSALASLSIAKMTKLMGMHRILLIATIGVSIFFILQYMMPDVWSLGICRSIAGFFMGLITPVANTLISLSVPVERKGIVFGALSGFVMMGNVLGPMISGMVANWFGYGMVFWMTAAIFAVAAVSVGRKQS
ncbi:MFS transporter [Veillonella caviae]|uniref:MFS transporter n=1 Tax=Veillonella caviae TaxID=248316 RepID=UPI0023A7C0B5|nr:MFS transporter [Veillonella caviae]MCI5707930.1 MFS transporter [Veillonella caviae]MCI6406639.1 MFS transporter [Veillonella caviae]MCI7693716.1 MFS transporter [Veillonella caviae]MDD7291251.1 MFS transporter [Veillonella caviae]MDY4746945.1 MFS transporter [Veillonella caviae]